MTHILTQLKVMFDATMLHYRAKRQGREIALVRRGDNGLVGIHENVLFLTQ